VAHQLTARARASWGIAAVALLVLLTLLIYEPWVDRGFDIADFSEFQPILEAHETVLGRYSALVDYYATHGRWNALSYAFLSLKWSLLGPNPVAWQWLRFFQMTLILVMLLGILSALRLRAAAALSATAIFALSGAAVNSYIRLTLGEPLAVSCFLLAILLSISYQRSSGWRLSAPAIALLLGGIVAAKEVLVLLVPFVLLIALAWGGEGWTKPVRSRRNAHLLIWSFGSIGVSSVFVVLALLRQDPDAFVSEYGAAPGGIVQLAALAAYMAMPVHRAIPSPFFMMLYPGNLILLVLLLATAVLWWRGRGRSDWVTVAASIGMPIIGAIVYSPWPSIGEFYALPFVLGTAMLVAISLHYAVVSDRRIGWAASSLAIVAIAYCAVAADASAKARFAQRVIHNRAVGLIATASYADTVVVETRNGSGVWRDLTATLERAAHNRSTAPIPPVVAKACADSTDNGTASSLILIFPPDCSGHTPSQTVASRFRLLNWASLRWMTDSAAFGVRRIALRDPT
jgi:hypothetical protein